jgi:hypothetical protein
VSCRNFADPLTVTRAIGRCDAKNAIPTGTRRRRRIPPPFRSYSSVATYLQRIRVCAAVQVSPILRIPPRSSRNLMEASFTTRKRRASAASRWHSSHTGMSLPCVQRYPSKLAHSDGNCASSRSLATRAQSGLCRPICADYSAHKLHVRCARHRGCMRAAGICWVAPGKPPLVAYVCGAMLIMRSDNNYSPEWPPLAARHDDLSTPAYVPTELGSGFVAGRPRQHQTALRTSYCPIGSSWRALPVATPMRTLSMACGLCMLYMIRSAELLKVGAAQPLQGPVVSLRLGNNPAPEPILRRDTMRI